MPKPPTAADLALARQREAYLKRHRLRVFRLGAYNLMRMVGTATSDRAAIARVRSRFTRGGWLQWPGSTFDHMECLGRDRMPMLFVSHPYRIDDAGRADLELFRSAGLRVAIEGKEQSWYGYGTEHVRIEHPAFSGQVVRPAPPTPRPAPHAGRFPAETAAERRLRLAGPALLALAKERAAELAAAIRLVPCVGPRSMAPCLACELREDYARLVAVIGEVDGPGSLDSAEPPLFDD
jgi:hypothetical protein